MYEDVSTVLAALKHCAPGTNNCSGCPLQDKCKGVGNAAMASAIRIIEAMKPSEETMREGIIRGLRLMVKVTPPVMHNTLETAASMLEKDPPEIVRCKDCKHYGDPKSPCPDNDCPCQCMDSFYSWIPDPDWYCGDGERR